MYVSKSYLVPNIVKRHIFMCALVRVYVIKMSIMSRIMYHNTLWNMNIRICIMYDVCIWHVTVYWYISVSWCVNTIPCQFRIRYRIVIPTPKPGRYFLCVCCVHTRYAVRVCVCAEREIRISFRKKKKNEYPFRNKTDTGYPWVTTHCYKFWLRIQKATRYGYVSTCRGLLVLGHEHEHLSDVIPATCAKRGCGSLAGAFGGGRPGVMVWWFSHRGS